MALGDESEDVFLQKIEVFKNVILKTPVFPYLWIPHCIMMNLALRGTIGHGDAALKFSKKHPLSCFILAALYTYPGGILSNVFLAQPPLGFLTQHNPFYAFVAVWYLMFFGPFDILYKTLMNIPKISLLFSLVQDWLRVGLVAGGVTQVFSLHPSAFLYSVVISTIKSSGFMLVKYLEHAAQHGFTKGFVFPHHSSKTMVLAAVLFTAQKHGHLQADWDTLYFLLVIWAVAARIFTSLIYQNWDPYSLMETKVCCILYGADKDDPPQEKTESKSSPEDKAKSKKENKKDN